MMNNRWIRYTSAWTLCVLLFVLLSCPLFAQEESKLLRTEDIRIRDPYIYADTTMQQYYLYAQTDNRRWRQANVASVKGVEVYVSSDLKNWALPRPVLELSDTAWARQKVWAPEMHAYRGKFYLFVTLTGSDTLPPSTDFGPPPDWPKLRERGTQIFVSDSPLGPFEPFRNRPHTPEDWMALDGTLYEEDGIPFMVFCHEWVQIGDGSVEYVQLKEDLSGTVGNPKTMFRASEASWVTEKRRKVTDGCFLYRTEHRKATDDLVKQRRGGVCYWYCDFPNRNSGGSLDPTGRFALCA